MTAEHKDKRKASSGFVHRAFKISLIIKGIDGVLELIGGALLLLVKPATISTAVRSITRYELVEDRHSYIAAIILHASNHLSLDKKFLASIYLLAHGVIKIVLVLGLLNGKRGVYPYAFLFLGVFVVLEILRLSEVFSIGVLSLMLFDLFLISMVYLEYKHAQ